MQFDRLQRREFITLAGAATAWPLAARAQQGERMRRVGVMMSTAAEHSESKARLAAFVQRMHELGWVDGRNLRLDIRWPGTDSARVRADAAELVALAPDVILATGTSSLSPLLAVTRTVPIVFVAVADPVGGGFVESLARPGGNATGFTVFEYAIAAKWLELLKQMVPALVRAAVLRDSQQISGGGQFGAIQAVAPSLGVELSPIDLRDPAEIERALAAFAQSNRGLIVTAGALTLAHSDLIVALAARYRLPAVYWTRFQVTGGGLMAYGTDQIDQYRQAAGYVDRILKGEKPADLPVQAPTKYELVINLKTAKALGIEVPAMLLGRADEVIE